MGEQNFDLIVIGILIFVSCLSVVILMASALFDFIEYRKKKRRDSRPG